jgi:hypothetical protein
MVYNGNLYSLYAIQAAKQKARVALSSAGFSSIRRSFLAEKFRQSIISISRSCNRLMAAAAECSSISSPCSSSMR